MRALLDPAGVDVDAAREAAAAELRDALQHGGPHVHLGLLADPERVVEEVDDARGAARPGLDLEDQQIILEARPEADLPGLEMAAERREVKGGRRAGDDADRPVPGTGHAHDVLVAHTHDAGIPRDLL